MPVHTWTHLTTTDFPRLDRENTLVLMPLGSTEQHGPHLPVGTDYFLVREVLRLLRPQIDDLEVILLPALWCTKSNEHIAFTGSLYLQAETFMAMIHDIAAAVRASGFRKLVFLNWHGGNSDLLSVLTRDIRQRQGLLTFLIDIVYIFMGPESDETGAVGQVDIHAGRYETGMMLAAYPELVKPGPYEDVGSDLERGRLSASFSGYRLILPEGGPVRLGWEAHDLSPDGVVGNPAGAGPGEGERDLNRLVERVAAMLREVATFEFKDPPGE